MFSDALRTKRIRNFYRACVKNAIHFCVHFLSSLNFLANSFEVGRKYQLSGSSFPGPASALSSGINWSLLSDLAWSTHYPIALMINFNVLASSCRIDQPTTAIGFRCLFDPWPDFTVNKNVKIVRMSWRSSCSPKQRNRSWSWTAGYLAHSPKQRKGKWLDFSKLYIAGTLSHFHGEVVWLPWSKLYECWHLFTSKWSSSLKWMVVGG